MINIVISQLACDNEFNDVKGSSYVNDLSITNPQPEDMAEEKKFLTKHYDKTCSILMSHHMVVILLFRIMSIPITFRLFRVMMSEMLGRLLLVFTLLCDKVNIS